MVMTATHRTVQSGIHWRRRAAGLTLFAIASVVLVVAFAIDLLDAVRSREFETVTLVPFGSFMLVALGSSFMAVYVGLQAAGPRTSVAFPDHAIGPGVPVRFHWRIVQRAERLRSIVFEVECWRRSKSRQVRKSFQRPRELVRQVPVRIVRREDGSGTGEFTMPADVESPGSADTGTVCEWVLVAHVVPTRGVPSFDEFSVPATTP